MIYGVGVDIVVVAQLEDLRGKYDDPFFRKTYTVKEFEAGMERSDPIRYFAGRFAAKEAVFKALNVNSAAFRWSDIETLNNDSGLPCISLYGKSKEHFDEIGGRFLRVSISYDSSYAVAFALCEV